MRGLVIALIVVALLLLLGLIFVVFLIRYLTKNQTDVTDPSGKTISPIESSGGTIGDKKSVSDTDGISVKVPGEKSSPTPSGGGALGKTPSDPEQAAVISAMRTPENKPESLYIKGNTKLGPSATTDDDKHVEGMPPELKLPPSFFGFLSIEKSSAKGKKSKELIKLAEK